MFILNKQKNHYFAMSQATSQRIAQIDLNTGKILNTFVSQREAERLTGINQQNISQDCNKNKITKKFKRTFIFQRIQDLEDSPFYKKGV